jgi:hypothetical protein
MRLFKGSRERNQDQKPGLLTRLSGKKKGQERQETELVASVSSTNIQTRDYAVNASVATASNAPSLATNQDGSYVN